MFKRRTARWAAAVALPLGLLAAAVTWAAPDDTVLVTRSAFGGTGGNGPSSNASISADGRFVAFESTATNLLADADTPIADVYVRDHQVAAVPGGTITRVSIGQLGPGDAASFTPSISADGRFVAFASDAGNLNASDGDGLRDVYVRDREGATTRLVSVATGGANSNNPALVPAISADGRFVAFASESTNLDPSDIDTAMDIFRHDLQTGTTQLVSVSTSGTGGNNTSFAPAISADGRFIAFDSFANNLHPDDPGSDTTQDVYVRDMQSATTVLVSRAAGATGAKGTRGSSFPSLSADGRFVAFDSRANLHPDDGDINPDVYVRDLQEHSVTLASRGPGPAGAKGTYPVSDAGSVEPSLSADGRFVAFESAATNFPDDADVLFDVFVRDLRDATTLLVSRAGGAAGQNSNGAASDPVVSGDGRFVAFGSGSTNLDPADTSSIADIFRREPPPPAQPTPTPTPAPTTTPAPTATPTPQPGPRPVLGKSEVIEVLAGTVLVRLKGKRRFVRVTAATLIPDGSEIDTRRGRLRLTVARRDGSTEAAEVSEGRAIVDQNTAARPTTTLTLSEPLACPQATGAKPRLRAAAAAKRKRRLFVKTKGGRFRTRGNYAAGTASGTAFRTTDTCNSTRIDVLEGRVSIRDLVARRVIVVRAGRGYTARARPRR